MSYIDPGNQLALTTPSDLKQAADDLRDHARRLSRLLPAFEGVLRPVDELDTPDTWAGPFADHFGTVKGGWKVGLQNSFAAIRDMVHSLNSDAAELDARAAKPGPSTPGGH